MARALESERTDPSESPVSVCLIEHHWETQAATLSLHEQGTTALKHLLNFHHPGIDPLSITGLQQVGLLRWLMVEYKGDLDGAVFAVLPERARRVVSPKSPTEESTPQEVPPRDTLAFWKILRSDLETMPDGTMFLLRRFLMWWDPAKNPEAWPDRRGKYGRSVALFEQNQHGLDGIAGRFDQYLVKGFVAPTDDSALADAVAAVRELVPRKLVPGDQYGDLVLDQLVNPHYWAGIADDLATVADGADFSMFLHCWRDTNPQCLSGIVGKYTDIARWLYDSSAFVLRSDLPNRLSQNRILASDNSHLQLFYDIAPEEIKLQLKAHFPREFGAINIWYLDDHHLLPAEICPFLGAMRYVASDRREVIIQVLAGYTRAKRPAGENLFPLPNSEIARLLEQVADSLDAPDHGQSIRLEDFLWGSHNFLDLVKQANVQDTLWQREAADLVNVLEQSYYLPILKNFLFKPASVLWDRFHQYTEGRLALPADSLTQFLQHYFSMSTHEQPLWESGQGIMEYLQNHVLPSVLEQFAQYARIAPDVRYFKSQDSPDGRKEYLFLHQIDGLMRLVEWQGGILSSEPGTGKTVMLALAALRLVDQLPITDTAKRILVVGSNAALSSWERELARHIHLEGVGVVNSNTHPDQKADELLSRRLDRLDRQLASARTGTQIVLVNYDLFRSQKFQDLLGRHNFDVAVVDEAHTVKSGFVESLTEELVFDQGGQVTTAVSKLARRTTGLYHFISGHPQMRTFLATGTPFVKKLTESLLMVHLVRPDLMPLESIRELANDVAGTHRALRSVMVRHRKEQLGNLPPRRVSFVPVDMGSIGDEAQRVFTETIAALTDEDGIQGNSVSRFYRIWAAECRAKLPWLEEQVRSFLAEGRKVIIFTPFVNEGDKHTASISTRAIERYLHQVGISSTAVLDGGLSNADWELAQQQFLDQRNPAVLVGSYLRAGEAITLNSSTNRATEVIIFAGPNTVSRFLQAGDRVHRFGQKETVTIHVPFATGDLLGRSKGTYDEQVAQRVARELTRFGAVVDGLLVVEPPDIYQSVARGSVGDVAAVLQSPQGISDDNTALIGLVDNYISQLVPAVPAPLFDQSKPTAGKLTEDQDVDTSWLDDPVKTQAMMGSSDDKEKVRPYLAQIRQYPLLSKEQVVLLCQYRQQAVTVNELRHDESRLRQLLIDVSEQQLPLFRNVLRDCTSIDDVLVNCNLRWVATLAWHYQGRGLSLADLIQEGNIGLIRGVEKFDHTKGFTISTYTKWWIDQSIKRALADTSRTIRVPAYMDVLISRAMGIINTERVEQGVAAFSETEMYELLTTNGMEPSEARGVIQTLTSGVLVLRSLEEPFGDDPDANNLLDVVPDTEDDYQEADDRLYLEGFWELAKTILTLREFRIIRLHQGLEDGREWTLEEVGKEYGVGRERIRQIEAKAFMKLRRSQAMRRYNDGIRR